MNKNLALMGSLFTLVQTASLAANKLNLMTPLFLSADAEYLKASRRTSYARAPTSPSKRTGMASASV